MTLRHTLLFSALALVGGTVGGAIFGRITVAEAKQIPPVRSENYIVVPNEGLRFITDKNQPIAFMGQQGGGTVFVLLDGAGQPSVALVSGVGGTVTVRARPGGGLIEIASTDRTTAGRMSVGAGDVRFEGQVQKVTSFFGANIGGGTLSLTKPDGGTALDLRATPLGGLATIYGALAKSALTLEGGADGGVLNVRDKAGAPSASVSGTGAFASIKDGRTVWHAP